MIAARLLFATALAAPLLAAAVPLQMPGRAGPAVAPAVSVLRVPQAMTTFRWGEVTEKAMATEDGRRVRVGFVRPAPKDFAGIGWQEVEGGFVSRFDVSSPGALGLRVRLDVAGTSAREIRVRDAEGRVETAAIPAGDRVAWGPWTAGDTQAVEVFSASRPAAGDARLGGIVHFDRPLDAKAAGSCTLDTLCPTGDAALDTAIAERKKSVARLSFVDGGSAFACTGTLLNTERFPAPYFLTANHCIGRAAVAASITTFWFFEATGCASGQASTGTRQVAGGMAIVFADPNTDETLLLMNAPPPSGATFSGWDAARLAEGDAVVSLSHPAGDVSKWALATVAGMARFPDYEQSAWLTRYSRGIIQGGSSGSGLFTLAGGGLQLRAVLSATTLGPNGGLSCTNTGEYGIYNRFDVFYPQVARYLQANPAPVPDDHGNRPSEATSVDVGQAETTVTGRIDYPGDVDVLRIAAGINGTLVARAVGGGDTVGVLLDSEGERLASNDDAQADALDFGITRRVAPGTYYLVVTHWESAGTADYAVKLSMSAVTDNYTDLWWNPAEPGWGINVNHQGQVLFATLFTYEAGGAPLWLVLANGARQPDGSFQGTLFRASGPPFNAVPWRPVTLSEAGTMRLTFPTPEQGLLSYSVDGVTVAKEIQRQRFSTAATTCSWSSFDRTLATNFQDLWWNPAESGWGINLAHQGDTLFATLFTYGGDGRGVWYVMSNGERQPGTVNYTGTLFRTTGPAFSATPWTPATATSVGTMGVAFTNGNRGTLTYTVEGVAVTKSIQRQVFASPATQCEEVDD